MIRHSLQNRLTVGFLCLIILPLICALTGFMWFSYGQEMNETVDFQREIGQEIARQIDASIDSSSLDLEQMVKVRDIASLEPDIRYDSLSRLLAFKKGFRELIWINAEGMEEIHISRTRSFQPEDLADRTADPLYLIPKNERHGYHGHFERDSQTGQPFLMMSFPAEDAYTGDLKGVLAAEVSLDTIVDILLEAKFSDSGIAFLVDEQHHIVAHPDRSVILRGTQYNPPESDGVHSGFDGAKSVVTTTAIAYEGHSIFVVTERSFSDALHRTIIAGITLGILLMVLLAAVVGLVVWIRQSVVKPISILDEAVRFVGQGDMSHQVSITQSDEIGKLATGFNSMTASLKSTMDRLSEEITERAAAEKAVRESEEGFRNLFELSNDAIFVHSLEGRIIEVNEKACDLLKYDRDAFKAMPMFSLIPEEERKGFETIIEAFRKKNSLQLELRFKTAEGSIVDVDISSRVVDAEKGIVQTVARNITERKRAEEELEQHRNHLEQLVTERTAELQQEISERKKAQEAITQEKNLSEAIMNSLPGIFYMFNDQSRFVRWNSNFEESTGYLPEEIGRMSPLEIFDEDERNLVAERITEVFTKGEAQVQADLLDKSGKKTPYYFTGACFYVDGKPHVIGMGMDFTEKKQAEENLRQYAEDLKTAQTVTLKMMAETEEAKTRAEEAEAAQRMKSIRLAQSNSELEQFAYVASHDLQEPLRKIQAFGDRLHVASKDVLDEKSQDYLKRMQDAAGRAQSLINSLLTFSRVATRAVPFEQVDLNTIAKEVIADLESAIERVGGNVNISELPTIEAEPHQMRQLLQNLIGNGLKFHQEGIAPQVSVWAEPAEGSGWIKLCVRDNGIGFNEKYLDRVFTIFQRLHGRMEYEGTGIGLAIVRKIAEYHGGTVTAQSAEGEGSTFMVTLPLQQPE